MGKNQATGIDVGRVFLVYPLEMETLKWKNLLILLEIFQIRIKFIAKNTCPEAKTGLFVPF